MFVDRPTPFCIENTGFEITPAMFVTLPVLIAPLFVQFVFSLYDAQAGHQKKLQVCGLLLQVASLDDSNDVSDMILMASILTYPVPC